MTIYKIDIGIYGDMRNFLTLTDKSIELSDINSQLKTIKIPRIQLALSVAASVKFCLDQNKVR